MPRVGIEETRRRQLIEATIDTIHAVGFASTTVQAVSRRAGLSAGLVAHYFRDKDGLLEATLRSLATDLGRSAAARLRSARTPQARLAAVIDANLEPEQFDQRTATVWLAFWGQVLHSPRLLRIQRVYQRRLQSNLRYSLRQLLPNGEVEATASALAALIDGLWLNAALAGGQPNAERARAAAHEFLAAKLARRVRETSHA
jgi:transcriptional repressor BetI